MRKPIPPPPPGWNKTLEDLRAEAERGERLWIGSPEADWAIEYERSQIPEGMRFPRKGDVYEALKDMTVRYATSWAAPVTGSGEGILRKGDRVIVSAEPADPRPICVSASAVDYERVEARMVPASDRDAPKYSGFYFSFETVDLNQNFRLVHQEHP